MAPHAVCSLSGKRSNTFYRILESLVKLNSLIKVEFFLLFEFPVGRVLGYRKLLNYEFLA